MKSWMEERDLLIAQTMAFAEEVAASTPRRVPQQIIAAPMDQVRNAKHPTAVEPQPVVAPPEPIVRLTPLPKVDERADITKRIASFKAHQAKLIQDRDRFFRSVMSEIDSQRSNTNLRSE